MTDNRVAHILAVRFQLCSVALNKVGNHMVAVVEVDLNFHNDFGHSLVTLKRKASFHPDAPLSHLFFAHLYQRLGFTAVIASLIALAYLPRLLLWLFIRVVLPRL